MTDIGKFKAIGVETGVVGESELGWEIPYVFVGEHTQNAMIVQGAIHAREHLTALLVVNLAKYLVKNSRLHLNGGIYFVPMVNPDGVTLCQKGANFVKDDHTRKFLLEINGGSEDFSLWKANVDGIDLNVNFDADWGNGEQNVYSVASENYVGKYPECAKEVQALVDFTKKIAPCVTLSYHLKGEVVYWQFGQKTHRLYRDKRYAEGICRYTGYKLLDGAGSTGGYKDWCISELKIPSFTVEVGSDKFAHPFPYSQFNTIFEQNKDLPRRLLNSVVRDNERLKDAGLLQVMNEQKNDEWKIVAVQQIVVVECHCEEHQRRGNLKLFINQISTRTTKILCFSE